ncbi:MAG: hypothetical protein ACWGNV_07385 [Bacteroidales bacterium]
MNISITAGRLFSVWLILAFFLGGCSFRHNPVISIISDPDPGEPAIHGLEVLTATLEKHNISYEEAGSIEAANGRILLFAGLSEGAGPAAHLLKDSQQSVPEVAEALIIQKAEGLEKAAWLVSGYDDRGLMYGLLEVAENIGWTTDKDHPFNEMEPIAETPNVPLRAISMYTMNRAYWESRFYDEAYWARYMDMLARNRFNSVVVIFGYENGGFLAPCYPYFFDVEEFPDIHMEGMTAADQQQNLYALNRMIELAHQRGLDFKVGIWDHIYRGGVQNGGIPEKELAKQKNFRVQGVTAENLGPYTKAALAKFIQEVPGLDGLQLRMHNESGLREGAEMEAFWREVFGMIRETAPGLQVDLRAKELPESVIRIASEQELNFTITTKYWMEQMGLPFHPTHINRENQFDRRHGYADMLRYPPGYNIHWRLWSGGTQRILLWGDPEYVRRFVESTHLYDGRGFEINEPLATKMEAQPHDARPFDLLNPPYVYYQDEFERYWHLYQVFGRVAYNPETSPEHWQREFEKRFGKAGPVIEEALHKASWILPTIVAACSPYGAFPTTRGWPEKQPFGDLPAYARAEGSDIQQFASFDEEAGILIEGGVTAKRLPSATSRWFLQRSQEIDRLIGEAANLVEDDRDREFISTVTDLGILSNLALFHARRIPAAVSYRIFERTQDIHALDDAIVYESQAIEAWRRIVKAAGEVYAPDLMMGVREARFMGIDFRLSGHWKDELDILEDGLEQLKTRRSTLNETAGERTSPAYTDAPDIPSGVLFQIEHEPITHAPAGEDILIRAAINATNGIRWVRLRYRAVNQHLDYSTATMQRVNGGDEFLAVVPAREIDPGYDFMYFLEVMDEEGQGMIYPDLEKETPYIIVKLERDSKEPAE